MTATWRDIRDALIGIALISAAQTLVHDAEAAPIKEKTMADPKLKASSITIRYSADDGYRAETTYTTRGHGRQVIPPEIPLLEALEELARITALFGFEDQAFERFDRARARVFDFRIKRDNAAKAASSGETQS